MEARYQRVELPRGRRILVVSDLHGNLAGFQALLEQVKYGENDILIIVGDMLEKGPDSLGLLRYVIHLSQSHTVYAVCGNCDDFYDEIIKPGTPEENRDCLHYMLNRKKNILNEMCWEIGVEVHENTDMTKLKQQLREAFPKEFAFLGTLPDILETQRYIFVHAGLQPGDLRHQDQNFCRHTGSFLSLGYSFEKTCVVGHWPVCLYGKHGICHNPIFDREHNVISIDGGNVLKEGGQINVLILSELFSESIEWQSYDGLPLSTALENQPESNQESIHLRWTDGKVEILKREKDYCYCRHESSGALVWIPESWLYERNGKWFTDDYTEYHPEIHAGDRIAVLQRTSKGCFVKKDGVCGWYSGAVSEGNEEERNLCSQWPNARPAGAGVKQLLGTKAGEW